jgi:hypothetical protein
MAHSPLFLTIGLRIALQDAVQDWLAVVCSAVHEIDIENL